MPPEGGLVEKVEKLGTPDFRETEQKREKTASYIAYGLAGAFVITIVGPLLYWLFTGQAPPDGLLPFVKDMAALEGALMGVILGFYFSQKRLGG